MEADEGGGTVILGRICLRPITGVCDKSKVNSMVRPVQKKDGFGILDKFRRVYLVNFLYLPGSSFLKYISASAKLEAEVVSQWKLMAPVDGGATKVELRVTANFKIFKDSFQ